MLILGISDLITTPVFLVWRCCGEISVVRQMRIFSDSSHQRWEWGGVECDDEVRALGNLPSLKALLPWDHPSLIPFSLILLLILWCSRAATCGVITSWLSLCLVQWFSKSGPLTSCTSITLEPLEMKIRNWEWGQLLCFHNPPPPPPRGFWCRFLSVNHWYRVMEISLSVIAAFLGQGFRILN